MEVGENVIAISVSCNSTFRLDPVTDCVTLRLKSLNQKSHFIE